MPKEVSREEIKRLISGIIEVPEGDLKDDLRFAEDLGVDSMMALEMVAAIEKKYRVVIPEEEIPRIRSLGKIYETLDKLLNK